MPAQTMNARDWTKILGRYREPSHARSLFELIITVGPFVLLWVLMWIALDVGYWLSLIIALPAAGFLVRLFMIQHDCGHGAFFRHRLVNDWVGRVIGTLTLTPYGFWRHSHAVHHASSGNLGRRGIGDIATLTVREYLSLSWWGRLRYRLYRHPIVMFGVGPAYLFILQHRLPVGMMGKGWQPWLSTMATNAGIAFIIVGTMWLVGVGPFLLVHVPITLLAASIGVWLFYVQHQFEDTFWTEPRQLELARGSPSRQFALRSAGRPPLVHRQYRRAPCAPPLQPNTVLSFAAGAARPSRAQGHGAVDASPEFWLRSAYALGRNPAAADFI